MSVKEIFNLRRDGKIDEAYNLALKEYQENSNDTWCIRALAWCLIDLCKRSAKINDNKLLGEYLANLNELTIPSDDDMLMSQIVYVNKLIDKNYVLIVQAKELSKNGKNKEALNILYGILKNNQQDVNLKESIGWEITKVIKNEMQQEKWNISFIEQQLYNYLQLHINPPKLHSIILHYALQLNKDSDKNPNKIKHIKMLPFLQIWGIENFSDEDFEPYYLESMKKFMPSKAERAIRAALDEAIEMNNVDFIHLALPILEKVLQTSKDKLWCIYSRAQANLCIGKIDESLRDAIYVLKEKRLDFWIWAFVGKIYARIDEQKEIACYCKALSLGIQEDFVGGVRLLFATKLISIKEFAYAKYELEKYIQYRQTNEWKIPVEVFDKCNAEWYPKTTPVKNNELSKQYLQIANSILCKGMPHIKANLGDKVEIKTKDGKKKIKYNIYLRNAQNKPIEDRILKREMTLEITEVGMPIFIQAERENGSDRLKIYGINKRDGEYWDMLERRNKEKIRTITDGKYGFTDNNIFVPSKIIAKYSLKESDCIDIFIANMIDKKDNKLKPFVVDIISKIK